MTRNKNIDILKFFAIISVVCAHITPVAPSNIFVEKASLFFDIIGCFGVGIFFIISGYLFYDNKKTFGEFIKKKFFSIIIPWMFIGTTVFILVFYFNNSLSISNYLLFMVGYGSYLYYLVVLIILYIIYYNMKQKLRFLIITSLLSIMSIIFTIIYGMNEFSYLNVINWMIYFNIGLLIKKFNAITIIRDWCMKYLLINFILLIIVIIVNVFYGLPIGYWSYNGIIIILLNFVVLIGFIQKNEYVNNKFTNYIGYNSLGMYLIHMPIAGVVVRITNYFNNILLILIRPVVVVLLSFMVISLYDKITKKFKLNKMRLLIGLGRCEK